MNASTLKIIAKVEQFFGGLPIIINAQYTCIKWVLIHRTYTAFPCPFLSKPLSFLFIILMF